MIHINFKINTARSIPLIASGIFFYFTSKKELKTKRFEFHKNIATSHWFKIKEKIKRDIKICYI